VSSSSLTREQLYELVWSEPMLKVADRYDVSSSCMARVCTLLNVPRPERGYWAKLAVGKAPPKPPLPEARPGDESVWTKGGEHYSKKDRALPRPPSKRHKRNTKPSAPKLRKHPLKKQIRAIVKSLERATPKVARLVEEGERQAEIELKKWEAQQEKWRIEREEKLTAEALKQSREQLFQIIDTWAEANRIDKFFKDAEQRANDLGEDNKLKISERLQKAQDLIGSTDALEYFLRWRTPNEIYTPDL